MLVKGFTCGVNLLFCGEALPHAFIIGVFKYGKSYSTTIKHIYIESENLNESYNVAFDSNNWWNLP